MHGRTCKLTACALKCAVAESVLFFAVPPMAEGRPRRLLAAYDKVWLPAGSKADVSVLLPPKTFELAGEDGVRVLAPPRDCDPQELFFGPKKYLLL